MALDVEAIHQALANQIAAGIARGNGANQDITVRPYPFSAAELPRIEIHPGSPWVVYFGTFGSAGISDVNVIVVVELETANAETWLGQASGLVSAGTGETNSIVDAILADPTLGGVVQTCMVGDVEWGDSRAQFGQMLMIPVGIKAKKTGAQA